MKNAFHVFLHLAIEAHQGDFECDDTNMTIWFKNTMLKVQVEDVSNYNYYKGKIHEKRRTPESLP